MTNGISCFVGRRNGNGGVGDGLEVGVTNGKGATVDDNSSVDVDVGVAVAGNVGVGVGIVGVSTGYVPRPRDRGVNDRGGPILAQGASTDPLRSPMPGVVVLVIFTQT